MTTVYLFDNNLTKYGNMLHLRYEQGGSNMFLEEILFQIGEFSKLMFEFLAIAMIIYSGFKGVVSLFRHEDNVALGLLKGFSTGLSFLLGAEILKTIILLDVNELLMVGGIIVMRVALSILIHWEMKQEEKEKELERIIGKEID